MAVTTPDLKDRLETLLAETTASATDRQTHDLDRMIGSLDQPFVLFGAGNLGRKALRTLRKIGKEPAAFIDNNPALQNTAIDGVPILSPAAAAARFDARRVGVITTIWCGEATDKMADRIRPLRALGYEKIALFGHLAWRFPDEFLPHYSLDLPSRVLPHSGDIRRAFDLLSDDESREIFVNHIEWRLFLDYDLLPHPSSDEIYFSDRFTSMLDAEILYDIGAYIGDSVSAFLASRRGGRFSEIHSFEPSPGNFRKLEQYVADLGERGEKVFAHRLALGDSDGVIEVEAEHGPASRVGKGTEIVRVTTIDDFSTTAAAPTFIKIDIEGFEPQCLQGGRSTIAKSGPAVAVCVYHAQSHLWSILLQLHSYYPDYRFRLCPHLADGWDLVLYAVPEHRLPRLAAVSSRTD
ncbi:MAG: FkbM family methyltransferase [Proteobacteria bacterium]|nr:FkbM family methyltransferase [Pseudomonadota bacterium]